MVSGCLLCVMLGVQNELGHNVFICRRFGVGGKICYEARDNEVECTLVSL